MMKRVIATLLAIGAVTAAPALHAQEAHVPKPTTGPAGAPVPDAWDYVRLTPQDRYDLRNRARALPDAERSQHNRAMLAEIQKLPSWIYEALHDERIEMDCRYGTISPLPKPPMLEGWDYASRVPHQRYEFRLRARNLPASERKAYDRHLETELAKLPPWIQLALQQEAGRVDAHYGTKQCRDE